MEKITIIYGPAGAGKSRLARDISRNKKAVWLCGQCKKFNDDPFIFSKVDKTTEYIIIDDIPKKNILSAMALFSPMQIIINKRYESPYTISIPKVVLILDVSEYKFPEGSSITHRFDFIKLDSIDDYFKEYERIFGHPHLEFNQTDATTEIIFIDDFPEKAEPG